jgi:hypothetical protein
LIENFAPHLLTYPRSGSHYFDKLLYQKANFHIERSHVINHLFDKDNKKIKRIITIARDPKESISSWIGLNKFLSSDYRGVNEMITDYIFLYNFLYENADYVIDYNDLVEYPNSVTEKILELLEINDKNSSQFVTEIDYDSKTYIKSSKSVPGYNDIDLDGFNVELCYFYYQRLLQKKIII